MALRDKLNSLAAEAASKANTAIENGKLSLKINNEEKKIDEFTLNIGELVLDKLDGGETFDDEIMALYSSIQAAREVIARARADIEASRQGEEAEEDALSPTCSSCGAALSQDDNFCAHCGVKVEKAPAAVCPACGAVLSAEAVFCSQCGSKLAALAARNKLTYEQTVNEMTKRYDGYHFSEFLADGIYNPFSVLNALVQERFSSYWFATGTPTMLVDMLKKTDYDLRQLDGMEVPAAALTDYRADFHNPVPIIYQSGYLTIKDYDPEFNFFRLGYPNAEVEYGWLNFITPYYTSLSEANAPFYIGKFSQELRAGDVDAFMERLRAFFADIPYELNDRTERHYQIIFYLVFKLLGQYVDAEVRSARGRADAVVKTTDYIYVFEFKLSGSVDEALRQIDDRGYLIPYTVDGRQLVKVGADFNKEDRNIGEWKAVFC